MIERKRDTYTPICDGCGAELSEEWSFNDAVNAVKNAGWRILPPKSPDDDWEHYCRACSVEWDFQ